MKYRAAVLFGPPGSGKGTVAESLAQKSGCLHISTGAMFRSLEKGSEMKKLVDSFVEKGSLVPDEVTVKIWKQHVDKLIEQKAYDPQNQLLLLDGIPRTEDQVSLVLQHADIEAVIYLKMADVEKLVARMQKRATEQGRADDADPVIIRKRFEVYKAETEPALKLFDAKKVHQINADQTPEKVLADVSAVIRCK